MVDSSSRHGSATPHNEGKVCVCVCVYVEWVSEWVGGWVGIEIRKSEWVINGHDQQG